MNPPTHVTVVHVSDAPSDLARAISSAATVREALPDLAVRIIVNGAGAAYLRV